MIDTTTHERITIVQTPGGGPPYFMVLESQLDAVTTALKRGGVSYWLDDDFISIDDEPAVAFVNLNRGADVPLVQQLLDGI